MATVTLTENHDRYFVRAIDDIPEDIFLGLGGNGVFIIDQAISNIRISGTNDAGDGADNQTDTIELLASAQFNAITAIDVLTFAPANAATRAVRIDSHGRLTLNRTVAGLADISLLTPDRSTCHNSLHSRVS